MPAAVFDAGYKPWGQTPSTGDLHQAIACVHRLGLDLASLLHSGRGERSEVTVGRCRIAVIGIDTLSTLAIDSS